MDDEIEDGVALCLSGGGYRAMVFHLGALIRLNEIGLLSRLSRVSSVSGGSITAAYLGMRWGDLDFDQSGRARSLSVVIDAIREMARTDIDAGAIFGGLLLPGTISDRVGKAYDNVLFGGKTLQHLPDAGAGPRFVINATNVQSSVLWRFSRPYMGDYRVGLVDKPDVKLSVAVAASSAFPPVLSPLVMKIPTTANWRNGGDLAQPAYRRKVVLSDGGVYDNMGLETAKSLKTLLVSDAGQKTAGEKDPGEDWARHAIRVLDIVDNQVRSLRKRKLVGDYKSGLHTGCYWSVRSDFASYAPVSDPLGCAGRDPTQLSNIPTRLKAMTDPLQERLINWGYAITDTALRRHCKETLKTDFNIVLTDPTGFPYARGY